MSSAPRQNPRGHDVRFSDDAREYPVFSEDPPVIVQGRYQPPPAPRLPVHSLPATPAPGTPETEGSTLHQDDARTDGSPAASEADYTDAEGGAGVGSASYHPQTPAGSPAKQSSSMQSSPSSVATGSPMAGPSTASSSSSPNASPLRPSSDLCRELQHFPLDWPVREMRFASVGRADFLCAHAFASGRKSCVLHFQGAHTSDNWDVIVGPRKDGRSLTVEDVLVRIDRELYKQDDECGFYDAHPRMEAARNERRTRLYGEEDTADEVFRGIDFFSGSEHLYFLGLDEMSGTTSGVRYRVHLGLA